MTDGAAARRLTDQGKERKQQLLDQAAVLFAERGYADTRVIDICAAAGVAKGLFYWYFENKHALFAELVRSMRVRLRVAQAAAMDPDADPLVRIRQGTEASVRFMAQHRAFFALLEVEQRANEAEPIGEAAELRQLGFRPLSGRNETVPQHSGRTHSRNLNVSGLLREGTEVHVADIAVLIKEAQAVGQVPEDRDPQLLALGVMGAVAHFSHFHRSGRVVMNVDDLARFVGEWVTAALAG